MANDLEQLASLVNDPHESLNAEVKTWLALPEKSAQCTVAKALIALANHGGGFLVLGFDEQEDGSFLAASPAPDSLAAFSGDAINSIVKTYADPAFQVAVRHVLRHGSDQLYPVVVVPGGHRVPIMAKKGSPDGETLKNGRVYIRRPLPESAEPATAAEWRDLFDRCIRAGRDDLLDAIRDVLGGRPSAAGTVEHTADEALQTWFDESVARWVSLAPASTDNEPTSPPGYYAVAYQLEAPGVTHSFPEIREMLSQVRTYTGWRPWLVLTRPEFRPYVEAGALECNLGTLDNRRVADPAHADFWRVSEAGQLFLLRGYDEDGFQDQQPPGKTFDVTLPVWRIGEILLHAADFAKRFAGEPCSVRFVVQWHGLAGRELIARRRFLSPRGPARQDRLTRTLLVDSDKINDQLPELVYELLKPLYALFDLFEVPKFLVDEELHDLRLRDGLGR